MTLKVELFYSPTCHICPRAREVVMGIEEGKEVEIEEVNVLSPEGLRRAERYCIRSVPTIVVNGKVKLSGVPSRGKLLGLIEKEGKK